VLKEVIMKFKLVLEPSAEGGYTALAPSLPGCISKGNTIEKALLNIKEATEILKCTLVPLSKLDIMVHSIL
jgi:predicted RNase H-like HicB family nuclease